MSTIDVGMRLGDAIDPFQLVNGFEVVIGYECQERSNHPFSHSYDAHNGVTKQVSAWGGSERVCCLLVLNLVSSTLSCIHQPRPRLRVLDVCGSV